MLESHPSIQDMGGARGAATCDERTEFGRGGLRFRPVDLAPGGRARPRARRVAGRAVGTLFAVVWLPAATAVFGVEASGGALPASLESWAYLAVAGLPVGVARVTLRPARPVAAWTVFLALASLATLWCVATAGMGPAAQAAGAAAAGLPAWLAVFVLRRHVKAVWLENAARRRGSILR